MRVGRFTDRHQALFGHPGAAPDLFYEKIAATSAIRTIKPIVSAPLVRMPHVETQIQQNQILSCERPET